MSKSKIIKYKKRQTRSKMTTKFSRKSATTPKRKTRKSRAGNILTNYIFGSPPCDETIKVTKFDLNTRTEMGGTISKYFLGYCPAIKFCPSRVKDMDYKVCGEYMGSGRYSLLPINVYKCPECNSMNANWRNYLIYGY